MKKVIVLVNTLMVSIWSAAVLADAAESGRLESDVHPSDLRCESLVNPLGIDVVKPRLSWVLNDSGRESGARGVMQAAYQGKWGQGANFDKMNEVPKFNILTLPDENILLSQKLLAECKLLGTNRPQPNVIDTPHRAH